MMRFYAGIFVVFMSLVGALDLVLSITASNQGRFAEALFYFVVGFFSFAAAAMWSTEVFD